MTESKFPWEREALDFVRQRFPTHEPYLAWSNFEFIADDGSINEVDLLVFTPHGFFLIEIKSRPGRLTGDAGTWTWEADARLVTVDSPLVLANTKAKKLRSLLQRQRACQKRGQVPYIAALVFCSDPDLKLELQGNARLRVCLRDRDAAANTPARPGIMAAIMRRDCPGLDSTPKGVHDRPTAKMVGQSMEQAGVRPSQRHRKVSDYVLDHLIGEGPNYQDWQAHHVQLAESRRRVRLYTLGAGATEEDRQIIARAAKREYQLMETLVHPGVLRAYGFTEHELGPALILEHDPLSIRLDHFLAQRKDKLAIDAQLELVRQIAEVIRHAHDKKIVHRALSPQSILVVEPGTDRQRVKVFNWQVGYREATSSSGASRAISATSHVDRFVEDAATAYMAPEALSDDVTGEYLDVFSLGAIAYHVFSSVPPAANGLELNDKLRQTRCLQISDVLNGAGTSLQYLVSYSTRADVSHRTDSVADFLRELDDVERDLTTPDRDYVEDPTRAKQGEMLPGGYRVVRRLGQGSATVALWVERDGTDFILKAAADPEQNARVQDEADVLAKPEMRHKGLVEFVESLTVGRHAAFLMRPVFADKDKKIIETLGERLRKEGRLHIDLLQRFGDDLLGVVDHLEEQGVSHRDIKPDNIAVGRVGHGDKLHLVLFDFSLSRMPTDNVRAGTRGYLDPLLPLRKRWDLHAERYAAAVTLYEMATGLTPKWGDGVSDPSHQEADSEARIDAELFDPTLREPMAAFFSQGLRRDVRQRFDNAEEMLRAWRKLFEGIEEPGSLSDHAEESELRQLLAGATHDSLIPELGLGTRATNALDRANILSVEDLLTASIQRLQRLPGVGNKTRREILAAVKILRERLAAPSPPVTPESDGAETADLASFGVDLLAERVLKPVRGDGETARTAQRLLLGIDRQFGGGWPGQADVARELQITRARVGQIVGKLQVRWSKDKALQCLRDNLVGIVAGQGGVMTAAELAAALLVARGSAHEEPERTNLARAVVRAAVEAEQNSPEPRLIVRRDDDRILISRSAALATYARALGQLADSLADEDPLVAPDRVIGRLREVAAPAESPHAVVPLSDLRLLRLAAAVSRHADVSSRQELYPSGMRALRALKLSQGALVGVRELSVEQIHERVRGRYPAAMALPGPPALDVMLREAGLGLDWDETANRGAGGYVGRLRDAIPVTSGSQPLDRLATATGDAPPGEVTPEEADARAFEERLQRAAGEGAFLALLVDPKHYQLASTLLCRFAVQLVDLEGLFIETLRAVADRANVNWDLVVKTDAAPHSGDWDKLMRLVARATPIVEERLMSCEKTALLVYPGLLARYECMDLLDRLRERVGRRGGIPGVWLLVPGDHQALIDGRPVPIISPGQRARIPVSWLRNLHRANGHQNVGV